MKYNRINFALVLFVLSTIIILSSATDAFAAAPTQVDQEACLNNFTPDTNPCDTNDEWKGSNIQGNAEYVEGSSIPMRIDIRNLDTDLFNHTLVIGWDTTKEQAGVINHIFDYITTYDFTNDPHPCLVAHNNASDSKCTGWNSTSFPIPPLTFSTNSSTVDELDQPTTSWNNLNSTEVQEIFLFSQNATLLNIKNVTYVDEGDPSGEASNSEGASISITFETDSSHVILAYGQHIASPEDWINTAGSVSGQSAQVRCEEYNGNSGCGHVNFSSGIIIAPADPTVTKQKQLTLDNGGNATVNDFGLFVGNNTSLPSGTTISIPPTLM
jgi:hypothetical protein